MTPVEWSPICTAQFIQLKNYGFFKVSPCVDNGPIDDCAAQAYLELKFETFIKEGTFH